MINQKKTITVDLETWKELKIKATRANLTIQEFLHNIFVKEESK